MNKPLIAVVPLYDTQRDSYWMLPGYMQALENAGGLPLMLPLTQEASLLREAAERLDGFLFTGGQDVAPELYGETLLDCCGAICPERDAMETTLLDFVMKLDKPVLAICRGIQFLNTF
jgi:putative glutamine amidotransferase